MTDHNQVCNRILDTWDPGVSFTFTLPGLFMFAPGDPDPTPDRRLPRQHRERPVSCQQQGCTDTTWRADALCHRHTEETR